MRRAAAVAALVAVAGCASHPAGPPDVQDLAAKIGCPHGRPSSDQMLVREYVMCHGNQVTTFTTNENRDDWLKVAQSFGGVYVVGDHWAVDVESNVADAHRIASTLGGEVR